MLTSVKTTTKLLFHSVSVRNSHTAPTRTQTLEPAHSGEGFNAVNSL